MDKKLQEYVQSGVNLTTDGESDGGFVSPKPVNRMAKAVSSGTVDNDDLKQVFSKGFAEIKKLIINMEQKMMTQFDNCTSRINQLEIAVSSLNNERSQQSIVLSGRILKKNPAWEEVDEFNDICRKLISDNTFAEDFVKEISGIGGSSAQNCLSNIVNRCMSTSLLLKFSLKGQAKDKENFSSSQFYIVLVGKSTLITLLYDIQTDIHTEEFKNIISSFTECVKAGRAGVTNAEIDGFLKNIFKNKK